ncbi:multidrug and toxin extrusion protein 1 isoform X4 [Salvelinus fontinalis]|uniref:multidrug and toxin extrusion protein 1 isoform X4 n=1 Tax=Salvelinus fontinalis TaxID=8038 RepID=UPI002484DF52|nr:multidrug and toxin extrusion protein 1 isoform X4 [Salvelinus fontinalis]
MEKAEFVGSLPGPGLVAGDVVALSEVVRGTGEEPAEAVVSSRLFRCVSVRRWIPLAYREELYHVLRLTGPLVINVTTTSTGYGLALACDTLVSQAMFLHQLQTAYLQNQGIILPQMYTAAAANLINLAVNYILLFSLEMGVIGSAIANSLSQITICLLLYLYICWRGLHKNTWAGWSREALQEWGSYMQLAIPSTLMVCFEWWVWEIGGFLAGMLGEVDLAAQHVLLEIGAITYMFPLGVHAAACVRVGNALGAGDTSRALLTCKVALVLSGVLAVFQGIAIGSSRHVLGYIFTSDQAIVDNVSVNLGLYTFIQFFDALLCVCSGILVGAGKQKIAALSNLVSYYCVGLPVGIALMFAAKLRILGLWVGLLFCVILQTGFFLVIIFKLNWQQVAKEAQVRAGKSGLVTCVPAKPPIGQPLIQTLLPEGSRSTDTAQPESDESKPPGYTPVSTQGGVASGVEQQEGPGVQSKGLLSASQLVLRRGFTLLTALFLLATGVAVHLACPPPAPSIHSLSNLTLDWTNSSTPTTPLELTSPL